jgi:hypothetical protein
MPIAAFTQIVAAVVMPRTLVPLRRMAPPPEKADARHDLSSDTIRCSARVALSQFNRHDCEKGSTKGDEDVRPQPRRFLPQLALDADGGAEPSRERQAEH